MFPPIIRTMPNFAMPTSSSSIPPYAYPLSYSMATPPGFIRKRPFMFETPGPDPVDEARAALARFTVDNPLIEDWLEAVVADEERNTDNVEYTDFAPRLRENGITRLNDIIRFTAAQLHDIIGMSHGTAARLVEWATNAS
jgi:hypothetical protein